MKRKLILANFVLIFILFSSIQLLAATIYIDPVNGRDSNSGLSPSLPKQHVPSDALATGSDILLKKGTTYYDQIVVKQKGTYDDPVIIGAYGTGANPIINLGNHTQILWANTNTYPYVIVQDINFVSTEQAVTQCAISVENPRNITIRRCSFDGINGSGIVFSHSTPPGTVDGDTHVENCTFINSPNATAIRGYLPTDDTDPGSQHDITISHCTFNLVRQALSFPGDEAMTGAHDYAPYGVIFEDSTVTNTTESAIGTYSGIKKITGHTSYIRRNTFRDIGSTSISNINALQIQWARDLIIEDNTITNVYTTLSDGAGIILDFAWSGGTSGEAYMSDGVIVRRNIITGCKSQPECAAIGIPNATNCKIYNNFCFDNGAGGRVTRDHATGHVFYNNTFVNNISYGIQLSYAPLVIIRNNILAYNPRGLVMSFNSAMPVENHNCFFGNTTYDFRNQSTNTTISPDPTDVVVDPKLTSISSATGYILMANSPCKEAGITIAEVVTDITGFTRPTSITHYDIGCYEWRTKQKPTGLKIQLHN